MCKKNLIDPLAPMHPYRQIARIMSGEYPPHTCIPTESELASAIQR